MSKAALKLQSSPKSTTLPDDRLELVEGWGMAAGALGYVYRPVNTEGIRRAIDVGNSTGRPIGLRGAGRSYGDAAINAEGIVLDLTRMNRILDWNPVTGVIIAEPGVTIQQLWQYTIEDGWWPFVVPGTMYPTLGGCLSMNIHGKNNWKVGPIGDHVLEFELLLPTGEVKVCSRVSNSDLFHAAISGFGMLGVFIQITLQLKKVYSGLLDVTALSFANFDELFELFEERLPVSDYLVGWIDCFGAGDALGRGQVHQANYVPEGEDPYPTQSLRVANQELPDTIMGLVPKSIMWRMMKPLVNDPGMRFINSAKFISGEKMADGAKHHQSHAGFAFLLDYVPNWKLAYKPHGLIQYQSFIPADSAKHVFSEQLKLSQKYDTVPYLGVFKRHRPDDFLMTHAVDGYSFALDYAVTATNRSTLLSLTAEMDQIVLAHGGRFYFAKDSTLHRSSLSQAMGAERIEKFSKLKTACDPNNLLQTNLYRRLFG
jgi:decaprenylphospho-beta-D-ribofuranose 2-oxidase